MGQNTESRSKELIVVIMVSTLLFFTGFLRGGVQLVLADVSEIYSIGAAGVGILVALQHIPPIIFPPITGSIADKRGKKTVLVWFTVIFSVGCIVCGLSQALWVFVIGVLLYKAGSAVCEGVATALLSDVNEEKSQQYINVSQIFFSAGAVLGPLAVQFFIDRYQVGWQFPFYLSAVVFGLLAVIIIFLRLPEVKTGLSGKQKDQVQNDVSGDGINTNRSYGFITPVFICMFLAIMIYNGMEGGLGSYIDSLFSEKFVNGSSNAIALSCYWAGMSIIRLILGTRKYPAGKSLRICFFLSALLSVVLIITRSEALAVIMCLFIGLLYGPIWCTIMSAAASCSKGNSGTAVGLMMTACGIGGIIIPALMGLITASATVHTSLIVIVISSVIAGILCIPVKE